MIEILMKYKTPWNEFLNYLKPRYSVISGKMYKITCGEYGQPLISDSVDDYQMIGLLTEFLDYKGYYLLPSIDVSDGDFFIECHIKNRSNNYLTIESSRGINRIAAMMNGSAKAFQLLEINE